MPWVLLGVLAIYGVLSIVFAFVDPPAGLGSFFPVPAIFVFLPNRFIRPAGRVFAGLLTIGFGVFLFIRLSSDPVADWNRAHGRSTPAKHR
ncbi:MAG TPA: hypothetical protein VGM56_04740 [Byssovorax sp.]|jgi:hypothetical protein